MQELFCIYKNAKRAVAALTTSSLDVQCPVTWMWVVQEASERSKKVGPSVKLPRNFQITLVQNPLRDESVNQACNSSDTHTHTNTSMQQTHIAHACKHCAHQFAASYTPINRNTAVPACLHCFLPHPFFPPPPSHLLTISFSSWALPDSEDWTSKRILASMWKLLFTFGGRAMG